MSGTAATPGDANTTTPLICRNCGAERVGPFCARCGQKAIELPHTLLGLAHDVAGKALGIERGFLHTVGRLSLAPGTVTRDYLAGRTQPYTHPLAYLVLAFGAFALIGELVNVGPTIMSENNAFFTGLAVPFIAAVSRLLDRRRLNYAQHLIIVMYLVGHVTLILAVPQLATPFVSPAALRVVGLVTASAALLFYVCGYAASVARGWLAGAAIAIVALLGGIGIWFGVVFLLVRALGS